MQTTDWNTPPVFWWTGLFTCLGASAWGAHFRVCYTSRGHGGTRRECRPRDTIFVFSLGFTTAHQHLLERSLYTHLKPWFSNHCPGNTSSLLGLETSRVYNCGPTVLYIFTNFKSCCLGVWLPVSLKLGADWNPSLWTSDKSWHTLNNWDLSRINQAVEKNLKGLETTKS